MSWKQERSSLTSTLCKLCLYAHMTAIMCGFITTVHHFLKCFKTLFFFHPL